MIKLFLTLLLCLFPLDIFAQGNDSYTKLLLHCNGIDESQSFPDSSTSNHTVTPVADTQVDTAQQQFGTGSALFDGTGDYMTVADNAEFDLGTGDFAVDFWVRFPNVGLYSRMFGIGVYNSGGICAYFDHLNDEIDLYINSATPDEFATFNPTADVWYHIAITRSGTNLRVFVGGIQTDDTVTDSTDLSTSDGVHIGAWSGVTVNELHNGWIDEFRISKGDARWTANFTPPTEEYSVPAVAQVIRIIEN